MSVEPIRCAWCGQDPLMQQYHDEEWGQEQHDDRRLFEFLILESFQAGLSWRTILYKRENFRKAFAGFDPLRVSRFTEKKVQQLMQDSGIIRNELKIRAAINNAQKFLDIQREFGSFDQYVWGFVNHQPLIRDVPGPAHVPATTEISDAMSEDMGRRGFKFRGSTICYAFMQAVGMMDDHLNDCWKKSVRQPSKRKR